MTASHVHVGKKRIVTKLVAAVLQVSLHSLSLFFFSWFTQRRRSNLSLLRSDYYVTADGGRHLYLRGSSLSNKKK